MTLPLDKTILSEAIAETRSRRTLILLMALTATVDLTRSGTKP